MHMCAAAHLSTCFVEVDSPDGTRAVDGESNRVAAAAVAGLGAAGLLERAAAAAPRGGLGGVGGTAVLRIRHAVAVAVCMHAASGYQGAGSTPGTAA